MNRIAALAMATLVGAATVSSRAADTYAADPVHSSAIFRAHHVGAGYVFGRINDPAGTITLDDADPTQDSFEIELSTANVDTHNDKRDAHLRSPDFFNAKQYPTITFKSTSVKRGQTSNTLDVTGTLDLHGVTKTITVPVELTGKGEFPPGTHRAGIETNFVVKLSDYEIKGLPGAVGDEIWVIVAIEGTKR